MKHDFTNEEKLVIENLRLKIQLAEVQKQQAMSQLAVYTRDLLRKYSLPEELIPQIVGREDPAVAAPHDKDTAHRVLSQAEFEATLNGKKGS